MGERFDVIVVGTGFGGAITACRLAEAGARVLVLERGRRWTPDTYPRGKTDPWLFNQGKPGKLHGWLDVRFFGGMAVAQGAGVGGGSLCYSSVVMEADASRFADGWPPEVTFAELTPYYEKVRRMLRLTGIPAGQETARYQLLERAAKKLGWEKRFERVPLAIAFDEEYHYGLPDPIHEQHSKRFVNDQGVTQGTCIHLGNCDIGCDVQAKNTLDLNYIPQAEKHGAEVRPLHLVRSVEPSGNGYRVHWDHIVRKGTLEPGSAEADRVVLAAGSLGSTEILLRCRDQHGTLPHLSDRLGHGWSGNANFLAPAIYPKSVRIDQGIGPTISAGLDFMDGSEGGEQFYVEDDGFPNVLLNALREKGGIFGKVAADRLERGLDEKNPLDRVMVWLGEGLDAADGRLYLGRKRLKPWQRTLRLDWDVAETRAVIEAIEETHRKLTAVEGGKFRSPIWWRWFKALVTVHPLGGCAMGTSPEDGVVDHKGEVFGHPGLFVADGALLPKPTGRNPSMTIGALAERVADLMTES